MSAASADDAIRERAHEIAATFPPFGPKTLADLERLLSWPGSTSEHETVTGRASGEEPGRGAA